MGRFGRWPRTKRARFNRLYNLLATTMHTVHQCEMRGDITPEESDGIREAFNVALRGALARVGAQDPGPI